MKKLIVIIIGFGLVLNNLKAQEEDSSYTVNSLSAPTSPAFVILGMESSNVEKPTDPSDFIVSIRNATDNFSVLPRNFALEFAPGWVFCGKSIHYSDFESKKVGQSIKQGTTISFGINTVDLNDSASLTQTAIGFKMSIFRGELDTVYKDFHKKVDLAMSKLKRLTKAIGDEGAKLKNEDPVIIAMMDSIMNPNLPEGQKIEVAKRLEVRIKQIDQEVAARQGKVFAPVIDSIRNIAKTLEVRRWGFKLDLAGAMELDFPQQQFNSSEISKYGLWLTGGYEFEKIPIGILGVVRILNDLDQEYEKDDSIYFKNNLGFDLGARMLIEDLYHFTFSGEVVYRASPNQQEIKPTWRYVLNIEYQFAPNKLLAFSFGKNFDGTEIKGGNLIAALNLVLGFGSKRQ